MKKFNFDINDNTVYTGADTTEFYSKALLEGVSTATFRMIPGVKSTIKVPRFDSGDLIQQGDCAFTPSGAGILSQKSMEVADLKINTNLCTKTMEENFLSEYLKKGSNTGEVAPKVFIDFMLNNMSESVRQDLELAAWQGDTGAAYPFSLVDGLEKKMDADGDIIKPINPVAITVANVIAEMNRVYNAIPKAILHKEDLTIYVADNVARAYNQAVAAASNEAYYVGKKELDFLGVKMISALGMSDNTIVAAQGSNLIFLTDMLNDSEEIMVINQYPITGARSTNIATNFKFGVDYLVSEEIVFYQA